MIPNGQPSTIAKRKPPRFFPELRPGQLVRLEPDGPVHTVVRVSPGAAYVAQGDWLAENGRPLERPWSALLAIALRSKVFPVQPYAPTATPVEVERTDQC